MLEHEELTKRIIGCCYLVLNELGPGFLESVYHKALLVALREAGLRAEQQVPLHVFFHGECVGDFYADIVVEGIVIIELKAIASLLPEHKAQLINYLNATGMPVGLLVNFGGADLEVRRLTPTKKHDERKG